jgi:hypothetical protein
VRTLNSKLVALVLPGLILLCLGIWACVGVAVANAATLEVGPVGAEHNLVMEGYHALGNTTSAEMIITFDVRDQPNECHVFVEVGESGHTETIGRLHFGASGVIQSASQSVIVPAGSGYKVDNECSEGAVFDHNYRLVEIGAAGGGEKGEKGEKGETGEKGEKGEKGETGAAGSSGGGGGGEGETKVASFGTAAEVTLSEFKESVETVGWCIIGTMLALSLGFWVMKLFNVRAGRNS